MKKILALAALLFATAFSATAAPTVTFEGTHVRGQSNALAIDPSIDAYGLTFDARLKAARSLTGQNTNSGEVRVEKDFAVTPGLTAFVRGGVGRQYGTDTLTVTRSTIAPTWVVAYSIDTNRAFVDTFYSAEVGAKYAVTSDVTVKVSDRFTDGFKRNTHYAAGQEFGLEADYALTKVDTVGVKYVHQHGGNNAKAVQLSYARSF